MVRDQPAQHSHETGQNPAGRSLPLQDPLDRLTLFIGRYAMLMVFVIAVAFMIVRLSAAGFQDAGAVFDGRDILTDQDRPNYLRNFLELMSFLAPVGLLAAALWAFAFTKRQLKEAEATRLATLYATLEQRWSSEQMLRSKALFSQIMLKYSRYENETVERGEEPDTLPQFVHDYVMTLQLTHQYNYFTLMALPEYLEYIGMLWKRDYLKIDDIDRLLGMVSIQVASAFAVHIDSMREEMAKEKRLNGLGNAPKEFDYLSELEKAFLKRYEDAAAQAY